MSIKFVFTDCVQLATQFAQALQRTGVLQEKCNSLKEAADLDILVENADLNIEENNLPQRVYELFEDILTERRQIEFLTQSLATLEEVVAPIFENQKIFINDSLLHTEQAAFNVRDRVFESKCEEIKSLFESAVEKLNLCRQEPTNENFKAADKEASNLAKRTQYIRALANRCFNPLESEFRKMDLEKFNQFYDDSKLLQQLISEYAPGTFGILCASLRSACQKEVIPAELKEELKAAFELCLENQRFPSHLRDAIDGKIYELAPQPKGGKDWGKLHRFDDLNRFKQAFFTVLVEDSKTNLKTQILEGEFPDFFNFLLQEAFGPRNVDPEAWFHSEFPALLPVVDGVAQKFLKNKLKVQEEYVFPFEDQAFGVTPFEDQETDLRSEGEDETDSENDAPEHPQVNDADLKQQTLTESFVLAQENNPRIQCIDDLRNKIVELDHAAEEKSSSINKEAVKNLIKENLDEDLRDSLFGQIYFLAEEKQSSVGNWGEIHCADDLARLYRALDNLKISVAFS